MTFPSLWEMLYGSLFDHDPAEAFRTVEVAESRTPAAVLIGGNGTSGTAEVHAPDVARKIF